MSKILDDKERAILGSLDSTASSRERAELIRSKQNLSNQDKLAAGSRNSLWCDEERMRVVAYEYLCHLEEARRWMQRCLKCEMPEVTQLEHVLSNGVLLAKLGKFFDSTPKTQKSRIYDEDMSAFFENGRQWRHIDNINIWLEALANAQMPDMFMPQTTDVYDRKNMPKVIYCIHVLSHFLHAQGKGPKIQNLMNNVDFTDEEIASVTDDLQTYAAAMPQFGNIGGALAKEAHIDMNKILAAVAVINKAIAEGNASATQRALHSENAGISGATIEPTIGQMYQACLAFRVEKKQGAEGSNGELTQDEIQDAVDRVNHRVAIRDINEAVRLAHRDNCMEAMNRAESNLRGIDNKLIDRYFDALKRAQSTQEADCDQGEDNQWFSFKPDDLTYKQIQFVIRNCTKREERAGILRKRSSQQINLAGMDEEDSADLHEADALLIQAVWRGHKARKSVAGLRQQRRREYLLGQEATVSRIQAWYKGAVVRRCMRQIVSGQDVSFKAIQRMAPVLGTLDQGIEQELEIMETQSKNDALICRNAPLEKELAFVEQQAKLLEEQKITLEEALANYSDAQQRVKKGQAGEAPLSSEGTTNVHMEVSSRLQGYSHLLHTLQTDPAALIPLIPHAIDRCSFAKFVPSVVMPLFQFAQGERCENLFCQLLKAAVADAVASASSPEEAVSMMSLPCRIAAGYTVTLESRHSMVRILRDVLPTLMTCEEPMVIDPIEIYIEKKQNETAVNMTAQQAMQDEEVRTTRRNRLNILEQSISQLMKNMMAEGSLEAFPMPLRSLCYYMQEALTAKFSKQAVDVYYKFATDVVLSRYLAITIANAARYGLVTSPVQIGSNQHRNLHTLSNIVVELGKYRGADGSQVSLASDYLPAAPMAQGAAGSTPSSIRSEEATIIYDENGALADVLIQTYGPVMIRFFSKLPADGALGMRRFTSERDAAMTAPPTVTLPTLDLLRTHMAISSMDLDGSSELAKVIGDMAPLPEGIKPFVKKNELPSEFKNTMLGNDTVTLTLTPRPKALDFQSHTDATMRLMRCKAMALAVLLSQHGESMDAILNTPATPAQCAAHDANIKVLKGNQETAQRSASVHRQGSRRSTAFKENLQKIIPVITRPLEDVKSQLTAEVDMYASEAGLSSDQAWRDVFLAIVKDLQAQAELGRDRSVELAQAKELTVKLEEKHAWMLSQLDAFGSYFKARQDHKLNAKKSSGLKALVKALTKGSSGGDTQKVSGQKWQSGKVLKSLDNVDNLKKISFEIVRQGADSYKVTVLPQTGAPCAEFSYSSLLQLQQKGIATYRSGALVFNVPELAAWVARKFPDN